MVEEMTKRAVHFVGFRGEEYWSAVKVWGLPDVIHFHWDMRAQREIWDGDIVVFAKGEKYVDAPSPYNFDDSNQRDDPAYWERLNRPMPKEKTRRV